ncbi:hypothetical protein [Ensifer soli]|uniref:hypothetical protein n=1 Tax=Ciceribacter sp. sgz301302 TaxID=3342379 RepID=UPI0035B7C84B
MIGIEPLAARRDQDEVGGADRVAGGQVGGTLEIDYDKEIPRRSTLERVDDCFLVNPGRDGERLYADHARRMVGIGVDQGLRLAGRTSDMGENKCDRRFFDPTFCGREDDDGQGDGFLPTSP